MGALVGLVLHVHKTHMCNFCHFMHAEINLPAMYDIEHMYNNFHMRDKFVQLMFAWCSREVTTKKACLDILDEGGSRWTWFMALLHWMPISEAALDYMHNFYFGITKNLFMDFLANRYLLNKKMWDLVDTTLASIQWPTGIGHLPTNISPCLENHLLPKADQWCQWLNIQCTMLWLCWRDANDKIPRDVPPIPANTKSNPTFLRNLDEIYEIFLYDLIAECILASEHISMDELHLSIHLVPNHHLAMHYPEIFWLFGPECFNGEQEKVKHNGKAGGQMELILLRNWVRKHRFYKLAKCKNMN
ncbi:hypothetical protein GY45DRAFT_1349447 [Cubamyces sp. BRFM 1775]|nr:hypothetical protein GY45DRAFT_1349447 [Cubamyces sp. BRFM 1775]